MIRLAAAVSAAAIIIAVSFVMLWPMHVKAAGCAGQVGIASFYADAHHGKKMANGKRFDMHAMTAASNTLPLGSVAIVRAGKKSVQVKIADRGGFGKYGRIIDLSKASFAKLAPTRQGLVKVCVEPVR